MAKIKYILFIYRNVYNLMGRKKSTAKYRKNPYYKRANAKSRSA